MFIIELLGYVFFTSFFTFLLLMLYVYSGRASILKDLSASELSHISQSFSKSITDITFEKAIKEAKFFLQKEWPEIKATSLVYRLKKQRSIEIGCYVSFFVSISCFALITILSFTIL